MHSKIKEPIITDCVVVLINQKRNTKAVLRSLEKQDGICLRQMRNMLPVPERGGIIQRPGRRYGRMQILRQDDEALHDLHEQAGEMQRREDVQIFCRKILIR